jgi:hypothetical protein
MFNSPIMSREQGYRNEYVGPMSFEHEQGFEQEYVGPEELVNDSSSETDIILVRRPAKVYSKREQDIMQYQPLEQQPSFVERFSMRIIAGVSNICSCLLLWITIMLILLIVLLLRLVVLDQTSDGGILDEGLMAQLGQKLLSGVNETNAVLSNPASPQFKALAWVTNEDPLQASSSQDLVLERYVLAVLYFSMNGDSGEWRNNAGWLSPQSICDWYGIGCDKDGSHRVTEVLLGMYTIEKGQMGGAEVLTSRTCYCNNDTHWSF